MLRHLLLLCCISLVFTTTSNPLSILIVQPVMSPSHHVWTMPLVKDLLSRGHHVHVVSIDETDVEDKLVQNLTFSVFDDIMTQLFESDDYNLLEWNKYNSLQMTLYFHLWANDMCEKIINTKTAKELLETIKNVEFDVIVQDVTTSQCLYGLWEKIRNFLDGAKNGAVVISLGTNVAWESFELDKLNAVILAVSKLKQRVLWKLKVEASLQIPDNVMIMKWIPQGDVLTHKNVKAIWTHGGLLSMQEAIWQGVPVIGMPLFADQRPNVEILTAKGAGVRLDLETLSTQTVLDAFDKILYNESYTRNMKQLSREFRDRPVPPLDLASWSVEYAARQPKGTLASPIKSQSWIHWTLFDIYALLFFCLVIILFIIYRMLIMLCNFYGHVRTITKSCKDKQM